MSPNTNMSPNTKSSWDPSCLRLDQTRVARLKDGTPRGRRVSLLRSKFIKGPLDFVWFSKARQLGVTALWVGLGLWFLRGLRRSNNFPVSNLMLREWGIKPDAKTRALRKLEKAGLITVERRGKRSPRVTLVVGNTSNGGRSPPEDTEAAKVLRKGGPLSRFSRWKQQ
jgi:DNA-binding transcriptional ArsR family regulator